jgi:hypothetical protein
MGRATVKNRDLFDYSLVRLGLDGRDRWLRDLGLLGGHSVPRRLAYYCDLGSVIAHPSASHLTPRTLEACELLAEQRALHRGMIRP